MASTSRFHYVATAQKPTGVTHAVVGCFTAPGELNLILGKTTRVEVHVITAEGLTPVFSDALYGRIATMNLIRLQGDKKDSLVITTEKFQFMVLRYDSRARALRTTANGDLRDRIGVPVERGQIVAVDASARCIALQFYEGLLKLVACDRGIRDKAFNCRLDEQDVLDFAFVSGPAAAASGAPTLAVLYRDRAEAVHLRSYEVSLHDKVLAPGPWAKTHLDPTACLLVPVPAPLGGLLILGRDSATYWDGKEGESIALRGGSPPRCVGPIDAARYLVADAAGGVSLLALAPDPADRRRVAGLKCEALGDAVLARAIAYLDGGFVFIGSSLGDSALVRLRPTAGAPAPPGSHLEPVQTYASLGPIIDFAVVDLDRSGQGQVVAACGGYKEGSLRIVRSGISIEEQAVVELPGLRGLWSLREGGGGAGGGGGGADKYLVQSFATETRVLAIDGEAMEEAEDALAPGFALEGTPTLLAANLGAGGGHLLQVTATQARVVHGGTKALASAWAPGSLRPGARITVASAHGDTVVLALTGGLVACLRLVDDGTAPPALVVTGTLAMPHEVACVHVNALAGSSGGDAGDAMDTSDAAAAAATAPPAPPPPPALLAAVGLWSDTTVRVLRVTPEGGLEAGAVEALGGEVPPRSVLLASLEGVAYLLAALGDGALFRFCVAPATGALSDRKRVALGSQPVTLSLFAHKGAPAVFAACDRPTVLFSASRKLLLSSVNLPHVTLMAHFSSPAFPDALALATEAGLTIGTVGDIRKLDVRTVHLGEPPRRVVHHRAARAVVVAVDSAKAVPAAAAGGGGGGAAAAAAGPAPDALGAFVETSVLRVFDDASFEPCGAFELDPREVCTALVSCELGDAAAAPSAGGGGDADAAGGAGGGPGARDVLVVGTSYILEDEEEPSRGRVLVFTLVDDDAAAAASAAAAPAAGAGAAGRKRFRLLAQREVKGGVLSLASFSAGKLVAGVNSKVQVYSWRARGGGGAAASAAGGGGGRAASRAPPPPGAGDAFELAPECGFTGYTLALYLDARPGSDFVVVGDLMKAVSLLRYSTAGAALEEVAASSGSAWMTAVAMLDDATALGADGSYNLFTAVRDAGAATDEERSRLDVAGEFHLGDMVNVFRPGSLVMLPGDGAEAAAAAPPPGAMDVDEGGGGGGGGGDAGGGAATKRQRTERGAAVVHGGGAGGGPPPASPPASWFAAPRPRLIFGTVAGALGVVISLPPPLYRYLLRLQAAIDATVTGIGGLSHTAWRAMHTDRRSALPWTLAKEPAARGFIDGDFVESFLELARDAQERVVGVMNAAKEAGEPDVALHPNGSDSGGPATVDEAVDVVEDLARLH